VATTYQGFLSAFTSYNSSTVGACQGFEITVSRGILDDTAFGEKWEGHQGGMGRWSGSGEFVLDLADLGQLALSTSLVSAAPISAGATAVFTLYTGKTLTGVIIVDSITFASAATADAKVTMRMSFTGDGAPVIA
jgi:hypothetical protein